MLENLIALIVLTVGLLGLLGFTTAAISGNAPTQMHSLGVLLAQNAVERVVQTGYNSALTSSTTVLEDYGTIPAYPLFKRVTVTAVNTPLAGLQTATVTVYWNHDARSTVLTAVLSH